MIHGKVSDINEMGLNFMNVINMTVIIYGL